MQSAKLLAGLSSVSFPPELLHHITDHKQRLMGDTRRKYQIQNSIIVEDL